MFVNLDLYVYVDLQAIRLLTAHKYSLPIKSGQLSVHFTRKVNLKIYEVRMLIFRVEHFLSSARLINLLK